MYKPMPGKGKSDAIEGILTGVERDEESTVKHFIVNLEKVTFLGQAPAAPKLNTLSVNTGTPPRLTFTGFYGSQGTDMTSGEPSSEKRRISDDRALEESEDKGKGSSAGRRNGPGDIELHPLLTQLYYL
ncbi:hypothetical protein B0H14DRAFT_2589615 [Mycena olivaceomarginata]|nr:hypothetical protein B0H14DRAFT_2589615 [Mycena olivaceomarginata]